MNMKAIMRDNSERVIGDLSYSDLMDFTTMKNVAVYLFASAADEFEEFPKEIIIPLGDGYSFSLKREKQ